MLLDFVNPALRPRQGWW